MSLIFSFVGMLTLLLSATVALAETPAEAFRRGQQDAARLLERLLGRQPMQQNSQNALTVRRDTAVQLYSSGDLKGALAEFEALLDGLANAFGPRSREYAAALGYKASVLQDSGRYDLAEPLYGEALAISVEREGRRSSYAAADLQNIADILRMTGRYDQALDVVREAEDIARSLTGRDALLTEARALTSKGEILRQLGRLREAEDGLSRAIRVAQSTGRSEKEELEILVTAIGNRALVRIDDGRPAEALTSLDQMLGVLYANSLSNSGPVVVLGGHRAIALLLLGRGDEAEAQARAIRTLGRQLFSAFPDVPAKLDAALGVVLVKIGKLDEGAALLRSTLARLVDPSRALADDFLPKIEEERFHRLYVAAFAHVVSLRPNDGDLALLLSSVSRLTATKAGDALRRVAMRSLASDPAERDRVRELQEIEAEYVVNRKAALGGTGNRIALDAAADRLASKRQELLRQIERRHPSFRALTETTRIAPNEIRGLLQSDEAIAWIITLEQPVRLFQDTYVWAATRERSTFSAARSTSKEIAQQVAILRCGLDITVWRDAADWPADTPAQVAAKSDQQEHHARCKSGTISEPAYDYYKEVKEAQIDTLPFDTSLSHRLYKAVLSESEAVFANRRNLLIVPSGALSRLPPQVLVSKPPTAAGGWRAHYLALDHAVTVLPSLGSLLDLQRVAPSAATRPYLAFANPHFLKDSELLTTAQQRVGCAQSEQQVTNSLRSRTRSPAPIAGRGGIVNQEEMATGLSALPDTADEVCSVARALGATPSDVRLGARATESEVKTLSTMTGAPKLSDYKVLHFATHGLLAGELSNAAEPGLALTAPQTATRDDDGYLSASEVAALRLDADWVVLSACNTAGPSGDREVNGNEALSGLARAFLHAQARALLVSHWVVDSRSTAHLVSETLKTHAENTGLGRAEAHRSALRPFIEQGLHPALWGPFVVVGHGWPPR